VFERFTERARQVVVLAQDEARALHHNHIGTEHILLGLLREEDGLAARVLESFGVTAEEVRAKVGNIIGPGDAVTSAQIPFTPRGKKVLELSLAEALRLGHNYIGTEHVLLGLVRENEGIAARILLDFDADAEKIRKEIIRMLSGPGRRGGAELVDVTQLTSPPLAPEVMEELERVAAEKELAIEEQQFERAASARDREHKLCSAAAALMTVWGGQPEFVAQRQDRSQGAEGLISSGWMRRERVLLFGLALPAVAFPSGLLVGWLIWG
jgi:ClpA/ClpB-like protein